MATTVFKNPKQSMFGPTVILGIQEHHLTRAIQVLAINQMAGKFPKDGYATFIGSGPATDTRQESPGNVIKVPRGTTRRNLATVQARFLPFPGRIYFENAVQDNLYSAFLYFMRRFTKESPRGGNFKKKNHYYEYAKSLQVMVDGVFSEPNTVIKNLKSKKAGSLIEIINTAPHASTIELRLQVMYDIAIGVADAFGPGVTVSYDYVNSDRFGLRYGIGTGGPSPQTTARTGRGYPTVYALPRVKLSINSTGQSNSRFIAPGRQASMRAVRKGRSARARRR